MGCLKASLLPLAIALSACGGTPESVASDAAKNNTESSIAQPSGAIGSLTNPAKLSLEKAVHDVSTSEPLYYSVDVPAGNASLVISFAWGKDYNVLGNPNIYVRHQEMPTTEAFDCRGEWKPGDSEMCILDNPKPGKYHILINPVKVEREEGEEKQGEHEVNGGILLATTKLFTVSDVCKNAEADIRAQSLTPRQRDIVCDRLELTQKRFKEQWRAIDPDIVQPIEKDLNHRVVAELYSNMKNFTTWMKYLQDSSNSSGVFHEESPEDPKSPRAAFRTFNGLHWTNGITHYWNLEHEFAHYLDGRYLKKGNYMTAVNHKISWWSEGLAQHFGFWNGPERLFTTAHGSLYPDSILTCDTVGQAYSDTRGKAVVEAFTLVNDSPATITVKRINHETGELVEDTIVIESNTSNSNFAGSNWHVNDRFVVVDEDDNCLASAELRSNKSLSYANNGLIAKYNTKSLTQIFGKQANAYTWGHLAFTFFFQEQPTELKKFIALTKQGKYEESDNLLKEWAKKYEADFQAWLNWGTKKGFVDSFEADDAKLELGQYITLHGAGDWGFKVSLSQDVNSLTIGSGGGYGKYDLWVGKNKPVHSVAALNREAVVCKTNETKNRPNQQCVIENAKAGDYYVTVDNETAVTILTETHLYACTGKDCQTTMQLPETPEPETVDLLKTPRILDSADLNSCDLVSQYELERDPKLALENFKLVNHSASAISAQRVDNETGELTGSVVSISSGDTWKPTTALFAKERLLITDAKGDCLGTVVAKDAVHMNYFDRMPVNANSCSLKEDYSDRDKSATNASVRNETNETVYAFWVFPDQMANQKTNGLLRRKSYATLAPGETWDNITWRNGDRIMLGSSDDPFEAKCIGIFKVTTDSHMALQAK